MTINPKQFNATLMNDHVALSRTVTEQFAGKTIAGIEVKEHADVVIKFTDGTELNINNTGGCCFQNSIVVGGLLYDPNQAA